MSITQSRMILENKGGSPAWLTQQLSLLAAADEQKRGGKAEASFGSTPESGTQEPPPSDKEQAPPPPPPPPSGASGKGSETKTETPKPQLKAKAPDWHDNVRHLFRAHVFGEAIPSFIGRPDDSHSFELPYSQEEFRKAAKFNVVLPASKKVKAQDSTYHSNLGIFPRSVIGVMATGVAGVKKQNPYTLDDLNARELKTLLDFNTELEHTFSNPENRNRINSPVHFEHLAYKHLLPISKEVAPTSRINKEGIEQKTKIFHVLFKTLGKTKDIATAYEQRKNEEVETARGVRSDRLATEQANLERARGKKEKEERQLRLDALDMAKKKDQARKQDEKKIDLRKQFRTFVDSQGEQAVTEFKSHVLSLEGERRKETEEKNKTLQPHEQLKHQPLTAHELRGHVEPFVDRFISSHEHRVPFRNTLTRTVKDTLHRYLDSVQQTEGTPTVKAKVKKGSKTARPSTSTYFRTPHLDMEKEGRTEVTPIGKMGVRESLKDYVLSLNNYILAESKKIRLAEAETPPPPAAPEGKKLDNRATALYKSLVTHLNAGGSIDPSQIEDIFSHADKVTDKSLVSQFAQHVRQRFGLNARAKYAPAAAGTSTEAPSAQVSAQDVAKVGSTEPAKPKDNQATAMYRQLVAHLDSGGDPIDPAHHQEILKHAHKVSDPSLVDRVREHLGLPEESTRTVREKAPKEALDFTFSAEGASKFLHSISSYNPSTGLIHLTNADDQSTLASGPMSHVTAAAAKLFRTFSRAVGKKFSPKEEAALTPEHKQLLGLFRQGGVASQGTHEKLMDLELNHLGKNPPTKEELNYVESHPGFKAAKNQFSEGKIKKEQLGLFRDKLVARTRLEARLRDDTQAKSLLGDTYNNPGMRATDVLREGPAKLKALMLGAGTRGSTTALDPLINKRDLAFSIHNLRMKRHAAVVAKLEGKLPEDALKRVGPKYYHPQSGLPVSPETGKPINITRYYSDYIEGMKHSDVEKFTQHLYGLAVKHVYRKFYKGPAEVDNLSKHASIAGYNTPELKIKSPELSDLLTRNSAYFAKRHMKDFLEGVAPEKHEEKINSRLQGIEGELSKVNAILAKPLSDEAQAAHEHHRRRLESEKTILTTRGKKG